MGKINSLSASLPTRQCFLTICPRNTNLLIICCPSNELIFFQCNHLVFYTKYITDIIHPLQLNIQ